jgi:tetratricopeptide (TPR) repeat protein
MTLRGCLCILVILVLFVFGLVPLQGIKTWYAKAQRCQELASLYAQAEEDIGAGQWDSALEKLNQIIDLDPTYRDASEKRDFLERLERLRAEERRFRSQLPPDELFIQAKRCLEQGYWREAIRILRKLRAQAPGFKASEVQQALCLAHFRMGVELLAAAGDSLDLMAQAIQSLDSALQYCPNNATVLDERRFADLYRQGYLDYKMEAWPWAVEALRELYDSRPSYMGGRARSLLCTSYLRLGDAYQAAGDVTSLELALQHYRNVLAIDGCDHVEAAVKEHEVYATLYPPTPTPHSTLTPSR